MIKVLIVDDSPVVRATVRGWLSGEPDLTVVAEAKDGSEAFDLVKALSPDLVVMDILMPRMNGLEATEKIMAYHPTPILIFSSVANDKDANIAFEAISRGALEVMAKPDGTGKGEQEAREEMLRKVRILSRVAVIPHLRGKLNHRRHPAEELKSAPVPATGLKYDILAVGASTGGPKAVCEILRLFPGDFPAPIVVVQHIADTFMEGMAAWLARESRLAVKVAGRGERLAAGSVYLGPPGFHLLVRGSRAELSNSAPVNNCRPSVDVLFHSLAQSCGGRAVAVLLTGMGADGAQGMKEIHDKGGRTIAQDEQTSIVFGMPGSAIELGVVDEVLPLDKIPEAIFRAFLFKKGGNK